MTKQITTELTSAATLAAPAPTQRVAQVGVGMRARNGIDKEAVAKDGAGSMVMSMTQLDWQGAHAQGKPKRAGGRRVGSVL